MQAPSNGPGYSAAYPPGVRGRSRWVVFGSLPSAMLDALRKHAQSWMIKVILAAIIISFIFFFGYSSYRKGARAGGGGVRGGGEAAAAVNGIPIPANEYEYFLDRNYERIRASFKDSEVPDFARNMAQQSTMQQLIGRELMLVQADELGINIPDNELADTIRKAQAAQQGGEFDPIAYRHQVLPFFRNRFGLDYELLVRQDMRVEALEKTFEKVDRAPPIPEDMGSDAKQATWTFESAEIDPNALIASGAIKSTDEAMGLAEKLAAADSKGWARELKSLNIESKKIGPIALAERTKLIDGQGTTDDYIQVFTLSAANPVTKKPIQRGGKLYVIRFVEESEKASAATTAGSTSTFFPEWMSKLLSKAKVVDYLEKPKKK